MIYVDCGRVGKFPIPKKVENKLNSMNNRELIIAYLDERYSPKKELTTKTQAEGLNRMFVKNDNEITHFDYENYYLQEMENRNIIKSDMLLSKMDSMLKNLVNYVRISTEQ